MNDKYSKYFSNGDIYDGLGRLMYARRKSKISDKELCGIAERLYNEGKIDLSSQFEKKTWISWNERYLDFLMNGMSTGRVSRDYLLYYSKVKKGVLLKKGFICGIASVILLIIAITILKRT